MAGALSGHILGEFKSGPAQSSTPGIVTSGAMSFDTRAHGTPGPSFPTFHLSPMPHTLFGFTPLTEDNNTAKNIATLQAKLHKKLGPEYISQRPGPGGGPKLTYAEGWKIINLANEVFGFNGWSSSIVTITTDFVDYIEESRRFNVGVTAIVRVTLRDGVYHEDVGYGLLENAKSKAGALDKCKKEAITDALKRTLRNFGNLLGNCLYDKSYAQEVVKIKVPPAKFDKNELYRGPEFEERIPDTPVAPFSLSSKREEPHIKVEYGDGSSETPISYVPRHLRQEMAAAAAQRAQVQTPVRALATPPQGTTIRSHALSPILRSGSGSMNVLTDHEPPFADAPKHSGLVTPIQTPAQGPCLPPPRTSSPQAATTPPLARMGIAPRCGVSFAELMPADESFADAPDQDICDTARGNSDGGCCNDGDEDQDAFPLSTQDGAFFATVDLGDGDHGRPISFDKGMASVSTIMVMSVPEPKLDSAGQSLAAPSSPRTFDCPGSGTSAESSSGGTLRMNTRIEAQAHLATVPPSSTSGNANTNAYPCASASGVRPRPQIRSGPPDMASASALSTPSTHAGPSMQDVKLCSTMTSMGGSHFPPGAKDPQQYIPKPVIPPCAWTTSNTPQTGPTGSTTSALKRSVDMMQAGSGSTTRLPIQGMGLAQKQQQQQQNSIVRRPSNNNGGIGIDPKRIKR